jgi:hypothetical protein
MMMAAAVSTTAASTRFLVSRGSPSSSSSSRDTPRQTRRTPPTRISTTAGIFSHRDHRSSSAASTLRCRATPTSDEGSGGGGEKDRDPLSTGTTYPFASGATGGSEVLRVDEPSNSEGGPTEGPYIPDTVPYVPFKTQDEDPNDAPTDTAAIAAEERELLKEDAAARKKKEAIKTPPSPVPDPDMGAVEPAEGTNTTPPPHNNNNNSPPPLHKCKNQPHKQTSENQRSCPKSKRIPVSSDGKRKPKLCQKQTNNKGFLACSFVWFSARGVEQQA